MRGLFWFGAEVCFYCCLGFLAGLFEGLILVGGFFYCLFCLGVFVHLTFCFSSLCFWFGSFWLIGFFLCGSGFFSSVQVVVDDGGVVFFLPSCFNPRNCSLFSMISTTLQLWPFLETINVTSSILKSGLALWELVKGKHLFSVDLLCRTCYDICVCSLGT